MHSETLKFGSQYYSAALIRNIIALQQDIWWVGVFWVPLLALI